MKSRKTTVAGLVAGGSLLALVALPALGVPLSDEATRALGSAAGLGLIGLGLAARDDNVTSEGKRAPKRVIKRGPEIDP